MRLHNLLSHDQQLADFTFSWIGVASLSLQRQRSNMTGLQRLIVCILEVVCPLCLANNRLMIFQRSIIHAIGCFFHQMAMKSQEWRPLFQMYLLAEFYFSCCGPYDITGGCVHLDLCWIDQSTSLPSGLQQTMLIYPSHIQVDTPTCDIKRGRFPNGSQRLITPHLVACHGTWFLLLAIICPVIRLNVMYRENGVRVNFKSLKKLLSTDMSALS